MLDSLRSRLVLSNLLISLFGLLVIVAVFVLLANDWMTSVKKAERRSQAKGIATQVAQIYRRHGKYQDIADLVTTSSRVLNARVVVVSPRGIPVRDSSKKTPFYRGAWTLDDLSKSALLTGQTFQKQLGPGVYSFQAPVPPVHRQEDGAVVLVVRVADVNPSTATLADVVLIAIGTALVVWLLTGLYFTTSIFRPVLRFREATGRMAQGDYSARVAVRGNNEISRLAASFNTMAEQVERSNRILRDFVANISHDLRTPLTMISGYSQALLDGTAGPEDSEASAQVIHEESIKMQRLVEDLLQLTRLESGLFTLDRRPVKLQPFVQRILERVSRSGGDARLPELRNLVPADLPAMDVDAIQLERAVRNLLENAIRYTPAAGAVSVNGTRLANGWIEIAVSDTGSGIRSEDLQRVFERFYRSDRSRERGSGHSGLGLAIVREIVEAHGGSISVQSDDGRGTTFRLTVPAANPRVVRDDVRQDVAV